MVFTLENESKKKILKLEKIFLILIAIIIIILVFLIWIKTSVQIAYGPAPVVKYGPPP